MNQDMWINQLAFITGTSRKQVIDAMKQMNKMPEVRKELAKMALKKQGKGKK